MATSSPNRIGPRYVKQKNKEKRRASIGEYRITHADDTCPFILRSCIYLQDIGHVMIDRANKHIKFINKNFECATVLKLSSCPFDLCASNKSKAEFYVTEPDTQQIHRVVIEKGMKLRIKKSVDIGEDCRGITCWKSGVAVSVMRDGFRGTLGLLDYDCNVKKKVWETETHTGLFKAPWYLASIKDAAEIVVSDQGNHSIICMDAETLTTVFIFKDPVLTGPRSLCVDSRDNIYVIGSSDTCHNVLKLSPDGKLVEVVLSRRDKLNFPSGICYHDKDDVISLQANREHPTVSVYRLKLADNTA